MSEDKMKINIGRVQPYYCGEWDSSKEYHKLDHILYNGSTYVALKTVPYGVAPLSDRDQNEHYWQLIASQGEQGPKGDKGDESAYDAAVEGGYTGTEEEFNATLGKIDTALYASDVDAELSGSSTNPVQNKVVKSALDNKAPVITDTASGAVASFPDGADGMPIKSLAINIEPLQEGSGVPSPENVRPISGWTGANVTRTGKNLLPSDSSKYQDGIINGEGIETAQNSYKFLKEYLPIFPDTVYTLSAEKNTTSNLALSIAFYDSDKNFLVRTIAWGPATTTGRVSGAVTSPQNAAYCRLNIWSSSTAGEHFQFELGSTTDYEPYKGNTYDITFPSPDPGTVYGGELTINSDGTMALSVTWAIDTYSGGFTKYNHQDQNRSYFYKSIGPYGLVDNHQCLSNQFIATTISTSNANEGIDVANSSAYNDTRILARSSGYADMTEGEFNAMLAATPLQVAYKLTNPVSYQLTAQEIIRTLYGTNNFWADCGPVTVEYPADTKLYIQKINAPADDDMTADTQIASGKYFIVGGTLYLSTTTIPAGDTIIPGTNCVQTNLAEALNALNV